ncbi:hypothetical protein CARUB_v10027481mg [Capsella rubella]|uniref:Uncharacterized protein n=1 Tax=Capsella rubella TaxID=81985 RepID=R0EYE4_9BRAS|nr:hypothetical protein CARUB_v10027481mg [Capsella rubella]
MMNLISLMKTEEVLCSNRIYGCFRRCIFLTVIPCSISAFSLPFVSSRCLLTHLHILYLSVMVLLFPMIGDEC